METGANGNQIQLSSDLSAVHAAALELIVTPVTTGSVNVRAELNRLGTYSGLPGGFLKVLHLQGLAKQPFLVGNAATRAANVLGFSHVLDVSRRIFLEQLFDFAECLRHDLARKENGSTHENLVLKFRAWLAAILVGCQKDVACCVVGDSNSSGIAD